MNRTKWLLLIAALVIGALIFLFVKYKTELIIGASCFFGGMVVENNWKGIVKLVRPVKK